MRSIGSLTAALLLTAVVLCSNGCLATMAIRSVGLRTECPRTVCSEKGPIDKLLLNSERKRLSISYHVDVTARTLFGRTVQKRRWIHLTSGMIADRLPKGVPPETYVAGTRGARNRGVVSERIAGLNVHRLTDGFLQTQVRRWRGLRTRDMVEHQIPRIYGDEDLDLAMPQGLRLPRLDRFPENADRLDRVNRYDPCVLYARMDIPETEGDDVVVITLPRRTYRTNWAYPFLLLLPVSVAFDMATFPIQLPIMFGIFLSGIPHS